MDQVATESVLCRHDERRGMEQTCDSPHFNPVVLAPTYNNAGTLADVLTRIGEFGLPMLIVNDGSTDQTPAILRNWVKDHPEIDFSPSAAATPYSHRLVISHLITHSYSLVVLADD